MGQGAEGLLTSGRPPGRGSAAGADAAFPPLAEIDIRTSIRPTVAEVDLGAIRRNLQRLSALAGPAAVLAVIKADAYGHGAVPVARAIAGQSAAVAVSLVEEGFELRAAGVAGPIVVLGAYYDSCHAQVLEQGLTPVIYDPRDLDLFSQAAGVRARPVDVHLKIDTGMSRLGIAPSELSAVLGRAASLPRLRVAGLCTHFAVADGGTEEAAAHTRDALARFRACVHEAGRQGIHPLTRHAANSAAAVRFPEARLDAVRPGLALFGALPSAHVVMPGLEPSLRLSTRIMAVRRIAPGVGVSYGGSWRAARPSVIATVPIGYADGYPRHVREAQVLVRGKRAPLVGAVCMDMMMIDVTDVPGAAVGDAVTLLGRDGEQQISVDDIAAWAGTVNYEILCGISKRVPRIYKD